MNAPIDYANRYAVDAAGCWIWQGNVSGSTGYGLVRRNLLAHRFMYEMHKGAIPTGLHIDHLCRVRSCVNPEHLEAVTPGENVRRGIGVSAVNARKTHCDHGHEFSPENTRTVRDGNGIARVCVTCANARFAKWYTPEGRHARYLADKARLAAKAVAA